MSLFVIAFVVGCIARFVLHRGGGLPALELRAHRLVFLGLGLQVAPAFSAFPATWIWPALILSYTLVAAWLLLNLPVHRGVYRLAFGLLFAGWLMNAVPIATNRGMPVSAWATAQANARADVPSRGALVKHVVADADSNARVLGDVIPVAPLHLVISFGDILLALGVAVIAAGHAEPDRANRRRPTRFAPRSRSALMTALEAR